METNLDKQQSLQAQTMNYSSSNIKLGQSTTPSIGQRSTKQSFNQQPDREKNKLDKNNLNNLSISDALIPAGTDQNLIQNQQRPIRLGSGIKQTNNQNSSLSRPTENRSGSQNNNVDQNSKSLSKDLKKKQKNQQETNKKSGRLRSGVGNRQGTSQKKAEGDKNLEEQKIELEQSNNITIEENEEGNKQKLLKDLDDEFQNAQMSQSQSIIRIPRAQSQIQKPIDTPDKVIECQTSLANEETEKKEFEIKPDEDDECDGDETSSEGSDHKSDIQSQENSRSSHRGELLSNQNIIEKFRDAMRLQVVGPNSTVQVLSLAPPPEDLIAKTVIEDEPVKTGAAIAFIKFQRLIGKEKLERMNMEKAQGAEGNAGKGDGDKNQNQEIIATNCIQEYILNARDANKLLYCRFGEKYIADMERRRNSNLSALSQPSQNLGTATYLINIKKLIDDYNVESDKRQYKMMKTGSSMQKQAPQLIPQLFYKSSGSDDCTLTFESRFESGNLLAAIKLSEQEYDLILQNDINTNGHTQWYFFRVGNTRKDLTVKFNIINLNKPDSLYNYGMRVLSFSQKIKQTEGVGWHRVGSQINYLANNFKREGSTYKFFKSYFTLTFTHTFQHDNDHQFFAHCFPYTFSDLQEDLNRIEKEPLTQNFLYRSILTRTLAGNRCDQLTITSKDKDPKSAKALAKKGVFLSARVHPGESNASWMMKGVIDYLVSQRPEAKALRDHFVFKIVPILNPDGVVNGNYRCSLSGQDLNRRWKAPNRIIHPVNFAVKKMIRSFSKERELLLYCDLHGHSRRKNIFMYGNNIKEQPHSSRVFPYIMSKLCDFFSFEQSRFSMNRQKEGTARIAIFKEVPIPNIFTLEASFCGADRGVLKDQHFSTEHFMLCGRKLLETLLVYAKIEVVQTINQIKNNINEEVDENDNANLQLDYKKINCNQLEHELQQNKKLINMTMGDEGGSSGSDSEPSADNLDEDEMAKIFPKKEVKKIPKKEEKKPLPIKKPMIPVVQKKQQPSSANASRQAPVLNKEFSRSPTKRPLGYNPFDRSNLRKRKPEMKDAWTQTTPKSKEQLERERREHRQRKNAQYLMMQQQQQQQQQNFSQQSQLMMMKYPRQLMQESEKQSSQYPLNSNSSVVQHQPILSEPSRSFGGQQPLFGQQNGSEHKTLYMQQRLLQQQGLKNLKSSSQNQVLNPNSLKMNGGDLPMKLLNASLNNSKYDDRVPTSSDKQPNEKILISSQPHQVYGGRPALQGGTSSLAGFVTNGSDNLAQRRVVPGFPTPVIYTSQRQEDIKQQQKLLRSPLLNQTLSTNQNNLTQGLTQQDPRSWKSAQRTGY